jgi:MOSC domain-containing protein YiiM
MDNMTDLRLISVQVGQPETFPPKGPNEKEFQSAINKKPVDTPVYVSLLGLDGDAQVDQRAHGGTDRAANVYPSEHYTFWRQDPALAEMTGGAFGENLTTEGLLEDVVCIGDLYRIGEVMLEVSQPRGPCFKLNRRWHSDDLMERAVQNGRVGWYFRVRQPGKLRAGDPIELVDRRYTRWTIARLWALHLDPSDKEALRDLATLPVLSESWRASVRKKL